MTVGLYGQLRAAAGEVPDRTFLRTPEEDASYAAVLHRVEQRAGELASLGVRAGQTVALLMDNSVDQVVTWLALSALGALHAPLNAALTPSQLGHLLATSQAVLVVADPALVPAAQSAAHEAGGRARVVTVDELGSTPRGHLPALGVGDELDTATLLFTSGTTGRSKACALSHRYLVRAGQLHTRSLGLRREDVLYSPFPLFHVDTATLTVSAALSLGATAALGRRFSASGFWDELRLLEATVFNFMGATLALLWKREATARDRDHAVRLAWGVPMPEWQTGFEQRFGIPLFQVYGLTDAGVPVYDPIDGTQRRGRAGRVIPEYEVRIDSPHPSPDHTTVGEILVRGREPGLVMNEYFGNPEATAQTLVDGWVRTGDLGEPDADGFLRFHGRLTDSIRRRGENISAFEVEELVLSNPEVTEACALGVPSELTEEDVAVFVVVREGSTLTPQDLHTYLTERAPRHMVPRYLEILPELPKTPTQKVEKVRLRAQGLGANAWDADAGR